MYAGFADNVFGRGAVLCLVVWAWALRRREQMASVLEAPPKGG